MKRLATAAALIALTTTLFAMPASAAPPGNLTVHCKVFGEVVVYPGGVTNIWFFVTDNTTHKQSYVSAAYLDVDETTIPWC